jgi:hypothetical protein
MLYPPKGYTPLALLRGRETCGYYLSLRDSHLVDVKIALGDSGMHALRSLLAAGAMLASVGVASAAQPTVLTEDQLDGVTAGGFYFAAVVAPVQQNFLNLGGGGGGGGGGAGGNSD